MVKFVSITEQSLSLNRKNLEVFHLRGVAEEVAKKRGKKAVYVLPGNGYAVRK